MNFISGPIPFKHLNILTRLNRYHFIKLSKRLFDHYGRHIDNMRLRLTKLNFLIGRQSLPSAAFSQCISEIVRIFYSIDLIIYCRRFSAHASAKRSAIVHFGLLLTALRHKIRIRHCQHCAGRFDNPNNHTRRIHMRILTLATAAAAVVLSGCAASPELISCLEPNRRVVVEVSGIKIKPPPKNKPNAKPGRDNVMLRALAQGDLAWDVGEATLKAGGKKEMDKLVKTLTEGTRRDKRAVKVGSVVITGYVDRTEAEDGLSNLDEERAKAVTDYLVQKGIDPKIIFWEGKDERNPVPVTKFCAA
jgi:outer membrane protein OmpA-like peptidoglycan-associated protein